MAAEAPQPRNRTQRGADRRAAILDAARDVFAAKGYGAASMSAIAARVGVVEGALYKHFASKRELLFEATRAGYEPLIEGTREQLPGIRGTRNRLRFVIWRQLQFFVQEPGLCRLIIHEIRPYADYQDSIVQDLNREATALMLGVLEDAVEQGELRPSVSPAMVRDVIYGGIEHVAWKALDGRARLDAEAVADDLTDLILGGVLRPPPGHAAGQASAESSAEIDALRAQVDRLQKLVDDLVGATDALSPTKAHPTKPKGKGEASP